MKKVHIVCLIICAITVNNLHNVNCCKTLRSRRDQTAVAAFNHKDTTNVVLLPCDNFNIPDGNNHETDNEKPSADLTSDIALKTSVKTKRDTPVFPPHSPEDDLKETPRTLIATIGEYDDNADPLLNNQKTKRNPLDNDPLKLRHPRDKKFMCLCQETKCHNKDCLQAQSSQEKTEEAEDNDKSFNGPKKFNIPFANNVNFDQRVIVDAKNAEGKPPPIYPAYANPQVYHYNPYNIAHPSLIYTDVAQLQPTYAPAVAYNNVPSPSPIAANLLKLLKNGVQNLLPVDNNLKSKPTLEYVPKYYSGENTKNEKIPAEPSKVTTPRQVNNKLYPHNYFSQGGSNIEDLRPAYGYSTDFSHHNLPYTTEVVGADEFDFTTETSVEGKHLPFGDPTTTNYAPSYYATQRTPNNNYGSAMNNKYSPSLPNPYSSEHTPMNSYENLNNAYPMNNQNIPQYDYNGMPISTLPPTIYTNMPGYLSQEVAYNPSNDDGLNIEVDRMINNLKNNAQMMSVPNDSDLKAYNPPQNQAAQRPSQMYNQPDFVIKPPASYKIENAKPYGQQKAQPITTLHDVNNGYTSHYNPQRTSTLRNADAGYKPNGNVAAVNTEAANKEHEDLFRGLERIILNNGDVSDTPQIQAIDERPATTYENTYRNADNTIVKNAVKKVLNNFVPGKSEDLLANYDSEKSRELTRKNGERLSPDLANTQVLKNLLNVPEVESMIIDTTNNLISQVTGSPVSEKMIKDTLRNVVNEIPKPTTPPRNNTKLRVKMPKRVPRYDDESATREVFEKIKSIIDKSDLGEEAATHPLAQNLIVKTVKHSLDKEKGVVDEAAIRRVFRQLVKSRKPMDSYSANGRPLIVQPKETMNNYNSKEAAHDVTYTDEDTGYKFIPVIPVNERRLQGGVWIEGQKNLVGKNKAQAKILEEKRRKELVKQLDALQKYNQPNSTKNDERTGSPYRKSDVSTREALSKYYDSIDATVNSKMTPLHPSGNGYNVYQVNPTVTTLNYQNYRDPSYITPQPSSNRFNLLITPTTTPRPINNRLNLLVDATPSDNDSVGVTNEPAYMGKLVPMTTTTITANSDNSNLVWIGDGVKLPLTMRKMSDGSYALTLADEVCQKFSHKKCPCCLPAGGKGVIARDKRNNEQDYTDDAEKLLSNQMSGNYRVRRESSEVATTSQSLKPFSNTLGNRHDFEDEDYEESDERNSITRSGPYKYQRYATLDKLISGSTRALGHMIKLVKDVVTEAHEKRRRERRNSSKQQLVLF